MFETMNIYAPEGTKVKYMAQNGYDSDVPYANRYMNKGDVFTVDYIEVGQSISYVTFKEIPSKSFNTVMFEEVGKQA